uniref:Metastasis associated 1 family, member 3 n=1 Tax=Takifugu rubripes TaxID=31033 RepID=A0A674N1L0_TAKRU
AIAASHYLANVSTLAALIHNRAASLHSPTLPHPLNIWTPSIAAVSPQYYVFFENSSSNPYLIRRIEELNKTASGNVEAKVVCFYRRRDISHSLIQLADKHAKELEEEKETPTEIELTEKQKHQLRHRELFLSRQYESLPATHIRGKCSVALLNETESVLSYLDKDDTFFYSLVYDPTQKTLLADKGEIRVGPRFQADVPEMLQEGEPDDRDQTKLEEKLWDPECPLTNKQIDQFLVVARAVGTFARALDCSSSVRQPSLHMSAAAASRDITLFHAMDTLHRLNYDLSSALSVLVPAGGPVLCRDEMEEWSASEAAMFEEALEKYGKDFNDIRQDFLPWKSLTSIIEYYYMWKTTDRYVQQKRLKAAEAESKLKQVYIPTYNKPNPNQISVTNGKMATVNGAGPGAYHAAGGGRACESCYTMQSAQWYSWGPPNMQCRLCVSCWMYWKKYGGLKMPSRAEGTEERTSPSPASSVSSGREESSMKTKQAFLLKVSRLTKMARHMCRDIIKLRRAARRPFVPVNCGAVKAECKTSTSNKVTPESISASLCFMCPCSLSSSPPHAGDGPAPPPPSMDPPSASSHPTFMSQCVATVFLTCVHASMDSHVYVHVGEPSTVEVSARVRAAALADGWRSAGLSWTLPQQDRHCTHSLNVCVCSRHVEGVGGSGGPSAQAPSRPEEHPDQCGAVLR